VQYFVPDILPAESKEFGRSNRAENRNVQECIISRAAFHRWGLFFVED
jgi:hypothetical protein